MTGNEKAMYTGLAMCRNTEATLLWSRSQMFIVIHVAALSVLGTRRAEFDLYLILGFFGMALGTAWLFTTWKTEQWVLYWEARLAAAEETQEDPVTNPVFLGTEWNKVASTSPTFYQFLMTFAGGVISLWFGIFALSFML